MMLLGQQYWIFFGPRTELTAIMAQDTRSAGAAFRYRPRSAWVRTGPHLGENATLANVDSVW